MLDQELRALERRFRETADPTDGVQLLRARLRARRLDEAHVLLAAYLGCAAAQLMIGSETLLEFEELHPAGVEEINPYHSRESALDELLTGLRRWPAAVAVKVALLATELDTEAAGWRDASACRETAEAWLAAPSPATAAEAKRVASRVKRAWQNQRPDCLPCEPDDVPAYLAARAAAKPTQPNANRFATKAALAVARAHSPRGPDPDEQAEYEDGLRDCPPGPGDLSDEAAERVRSHLVGGLLQWCLELAPRALFGASPRKSPNGFLADAVFVPNGAQQLGDVTILARRGWGSVWARGLDYGHVRVRKRKQKIVVDLRGTRVPISSETKSLRLMTRKTKLDGVKGSIYRPSWLELTSE